MSPEPGEAAQGGGPAEGDAKPGPPDGEAAGIGGAAEDVSRAGQEVHRPGGEAAHPSPLEERLRSFEEDRVAGMEAWRAGDAERAVEHWSMARGSLKYVIDKEFFKDDPVALAKVKDDQHKMHLNLAQGFLKTEEYRQVLEYAGRALAHDPNSEKALYRVCVAMKESSRYSEARAWIARLLEAHPGSAAAKQLLQDIAQLEKAARKTAKKSASKIFEGMRNDHDHRLGIEKTTWEQVRQMPHDIAREVCSLWEDARERFERSRAACRRRCSRRRED